MATLDGYEPYPIGLTAAQTVEALLRAYNLDNELEYYIKLYKSASSPDNTVVKAGDIWRDISTNKTYSALVGEENNTKYVIWLES